MYSIEELLQVCIDSSKLAFCAASAVGIITWFNVLVSFWHCIWKFKLKKSHCVKLNDLIVLKSTFHHLLHTSLRSWKMTAHFFDAFFLLNYFVPLTSSDKNSWNPWAAMLVTGTAGLGRDNSVIAPTWNFWKKAKVLYQEIPICYSQPLLKEHPDIMCQHITEKKRPSAAPWWPNRGWSLGGLHIFT